MSTSATNAEPRFPIYIPSKGRWESRITVKHLEAMGVPYHVIVEEQELDRYASVIDRSKLLVLDPAYQRNYDAFMPLEPGQSRGSGPARNFAWDHAIASGSSHHWCMDDNIRGFYRLNYNLKVPVADGTVIRCMEDFVLRFTNIGMAGPNYFMFASRKSRMPPLVLNTRLFSCNLIRNELPFRWRGRYNEDADLSLRILKAGWSTVQFNAFLQYKSPTLSMKGGNTDEIYKGGTLAKSQMLVDMHPDLVRLVWKFGRPHHHVDFSGFKHLALVPREDLEVDEAPNNYGMELVSVDRKSKPRGKVVNRNAGPKAGAAL
jgi:hypothetical protein